MLDVPTGQRVSEWERLRRPPMRTSGPGLEWALAPSAEVIGVGARRADLSAVRGQPAVGAGPARADRQGPLLRELADPRRTATLLAAARHLEASAVDGALDLFDLLMAIRLIAPAQRASERERLAALPRCTGPR